MRAWQRIGFVICIFFLSVITCGLTGSPVHAQIHDSSDYQLTVTQSTDTSIYGDSPKFTITLVHPATGFSLSLNQWFLYVDNDQMDGFLLSSGGDATTSGIIYYGSSFTPGVHTIRSTFQPQGSSVVISSNVVTHTVQKATPNLLCQIDAETSLTFSPGHQLQLHMVLANVNSISNTYQDGTYTITFSNGVNTVTRSNLTPEPGLILHVPVPTTPGQYELLCAYNGSPLLNPAQIDDGPIIVSAGHSISGTQVYSSLAQLAPNQAITLYIILHGAAGLPPPTGIIALSIGSYHTSAIALSGAGDATIHTTLPTLISSSDPVGLYYYGDSNYNVANANFSPPFAPLPGQTSAPQPVTISAPTKTPPPSSGSGHPPVNAATSIPTESTATPNETVTATPGTLAVASDPQSPTTSSSHTARSGDASLWIIILFAFLVLGGSVGTYLYLRGRRVSQLTPIATTAPGDISQVILSEDQVD